MLYFLNALIISSAHVLFDGTPQGSGSTLDFKTIDCSLSFLMASGALVNKPFVVKALHFTN